MPTTLQESLPPQWRDERLKEFQLREARKLPGWNDLNSTDRHVAESLIRLGRAHSGEVFVSKKRLAEIISPSPEHRGRPNESGHISRQTLYASLKRLKEAGIFEGWWTKGKLVDSPAAGVKMRLDPIEVLRLNRRAWARAWAMLKHTAASFLRMLRRNLDTVEAETHSSRKEVEDRRYSSRRIPDHGDNCALAIRVNRMRRELELEREQRRRWDEWWDYGVAGGRLGFDDWLAANGSAPPSARVVYAGGTRGLSASVCGA